MSLSSIDKDKQTKSIQKQVNYPCGQCDYIAKRKNNLLAHIKSIHEGVQFPCDQCDYKTNRKASL